MESLPEEILVLILLRVPTKFLLRVKAVCKFWSFLINSPSFINRHYNFINARSCLTGDRYHLIPGGYYAPGPFLNASLLCGKQITPIEGVPSLLGQKDVMREQYYINVEDDLFLSPIWGPVHGIYCMHIRQACSAYGVLVFWNPGTRQFHFLPPVPYPTQRLEFYRVGSLYCAFGFDLLANDHKVLAIGTASNFYCGNLTCFHIYSLSTNTWKKLNPVEVSIAYPGLMSVDDDEHVGFVPILDSCDAGFYFNGKCHWHYDDYALVREFFGVVDITGMDYQCIIAFDFGHEVYEVYKIPPLISSSLVGNLTSVDNCLTFICHLENDGSIFDLWTMREYGVEESWCKAFSIATHGICKYLGVIDDEFFVKEADGLIVSYRLHALEECYEYSYMNSAFSILPYRESLGSVKPLAN